MRIGVSATNPDPIASNTASYAGFAWLQHLMAIHPTVVEAYYLKASPLCGAAWGVKDPLSPLSKAIHPLKMFTNSCQDISLSLNVLALSHWLSLLETGWLVPSHVKHLCWKIKRNLLNHVSQTLAWKCHVSLRPPIARSSPRPPWQHPLQISAHFKWAQTRS